MREIEKGVSKLKKQGTEKEKKKVKKKKCTSLSSGSVEKCERRAKN